MSAPGFLNCKGRFPWVAQHESFDDEADVDDDGDDAGGGGGEDDTCLGPMDSSGRSCEDDPCLVSSHTGSAEVFEFLAPGRRQLSSNGHQNCRSATVIPGGSFLLSFHQGHTTFFLGRQGFPVLCSRLRRGR